MEKQWRLPPKRSEVQALARSLGISTVLAQLLVNRGIDDEETATAFLFPTLAHGHSPWDLGGISAAVARIEQAFAQKESIAIYGDYDVDGQTAVALLTSFLRHAAQKLCSGNPPTVDYYIPDRLEEGYGLNCQALKELSVAHKLVITADCGIVSLAEANYAQQLGLDLVITDHHEPGDELPRAVAVVNPKCSGCNYPDKQLAGVGVAFKLVQALAEKWDLDGNSYLDYVALGTVADVVPLTGENRIFTKYGLQQLAQGNRPGLAALMEVCGLAVAPTASDLGYRLGPRLNAAGRIGDPSVGVKLLLCQDAVEAEVLAEQLDRANRQRQDIEGDILLQAKTQIEENGWSQDPAIVVAGDGWHPGVIGIVASRLVEAYHRPTIVLTINGDLGRGSGRSIAGFNLVAALRRCGQLFQKVGGHEMAAGVTLGTEQIGQLRVRLRQMAEQQLREEDFTATIDVDGRIALPHIQEELVQELKLLEPCGMGNPRPSFLLDATVVDCRGVGREKQHAKCRLEANGSFLDGIGFRMQRKLHKLAAKGSELSFLVEPGLNVWNGRTTVQVVVHDVQIKGDPNTLPSWKALDPWQHDRTYRQISLFDGIRGVVADPTPDKEFALHDMRGHPDPLEYMAEFVRREGRVAVLLSSPEEAVKTCQALRRRWPQVGSKIGFHHSLQRLDCSVVHQVQWVVANEGWDCPDLLHHVVCFAPPIGASARQLIGNLKSGGELHFVFGRSDIEALRQRALAHYPDRGLLAALYRAVTASGKSLVPADEWHQIAVAAGLEPDGLVAAEILSELGLVQQNGTGFRLLAKPTKKLDLSCSVLYNNCVKKRTEVLAALKNSLEGSFTV